MNKTIKKSHQDLMIESILIPKIIEVLDSLPNTLKKIRINKFKEFWSFSTDSEFESIKSIFRDSKLRKQYPILCRVRKPVVKVASVRITEATTNKVSKTLLIKQITDKLNELPEIPKQIRKNKFKEFWGDEVNVNEVLSILSDVKLRKESRVFCRVRMK